MRQCTLPRTARLLKPGDFAALRTASRRLNARHFIAEFAPNNRAGCRLGQAVSRRVSKRAVDRNRIKRLVRDSYRHMRRADARGDLARRPVHTLGKTRGIEGECGERHNARLIALRESIHRRALRANPQRLPDAGVSGHEFPCP